MVLTAAYLRSLLENCTSECEAKNILDNAGVTYADISIKGAPVARLRCFGSNGDCFVICVGDGVLRIDEIQSFR